MSNSEYPTARPFIPDQQALESLEDAAAGCEGCPLYRDATQTVFGEGPDDAALMVVGEQPGQREDRTGHPFRGPAGKVLNRVLSEAGLQRDELYITNAVKHFKFDSDGGRRQSQRPAVDEIEACHPWLESELQAVTPQIVVALGTVAARSLVGHSVTISESIDTWMQTTHGQDLLVTYHPAAAIRASTEADRDRIFDAIARSLHRAHDALSTGRPGAPAR